MIWVLSPEKDHVFMPKRLESTVFLIAGILSTCLCCASHGDGTSDGGSSAGLSRESQEEMAMSLDAKAQREVTDLHRFFEDWFQGRSGAEISRLEVALASDFEMITPGGEVVIRAPLIDRLQAAFGAWKGSGKKIEIRALQGLPMAEGWVLIRYEEWHLEEQGEAIGRLSTAVFRTEANAPNGVEWVRLHETWLPTE